jgi:hypothetical protein
VSRETLRADAPFYWSIRGCGARPSTNDDIDIPSVLVLFLFSLLNNITTITITIAITITIIIITTTSNNGQVSLPHVTFVKPRY